MFTGFGIHPAINDHGAVAFGARSEAEGAAIVDYIVVSRKGRFTTIADTTDPRRVPGGLGGGRSRLSLNEHGEVAFEGVLDTNVGVGLFIGDGGLPRLLTQSAFAEFLANSAAINKHGIVAFSSVTGTDVTGITFALKIVREGMVPLTILDNSGIFDSFTVPSINDRGVIVVSAILDDGTVGIFNVDDAAVSMMAGGSPFIRFTPFPSINRRGMTAFTALLASGVTGVFMHDGTRLRTIADTAGGYASFDVAGARQSNGPSVNDSGDVAFTATLDDERRGIFVGGDPTADKVIATGDELFGSVVGGLVFLGREAMNSSGQIVFWASLEDGTTGIYRADPVRQRKNGRE